MSNSKVRLVEVKKDGGQEKQQEGLEKILKEVRMGFGEIKEEMKEVRKCKEEMRKWVEELKRGWEKEKTVLREKIEDLEKRIEGWERKEDRARVEEEGEKGRRKESKSKEKKELEERVRFLEMEKEKWRREERRNNIIIKEIKMNERREGMKKQVEEIIKETGAQAKVEEVRKLRAVNKEGRGIVWVKMGSFEEKMEVIRKKGNLRERKEWIGDDLMEKERKIEWRRRKEAERKRGLGKKVKIGYKKIWIEDKMWV